MLYFPQSLSGVVAQYPAVKHNLTRTVANVLEDGSYISMGDSTAAQISWQLTLSGLSTDEWSAIEQLFGAVQGRLGSFTFLDPTDNLLSWNEDFSKSVWMVDPLLLQGGGFGDPLGGTHATRFTNTAQANQRLMQHIEGPAGYQYCFSVFLRSETTQHVALVQASLNEQTRRTYVTVPQWSRFVLSARLLDHSDGIAFGIELPAGAQVDLFGAQVEAQVGAGKYKKTVDRSGVYAQCRFDQDSLTLTTEAPNQHSAIVRLISNLAAA